MLVREFATALPDRERNIRRGRCGCSNKQGCPQYLGSDKEIRCNGDFASLDRPPVDNSYITHSLTRH
jgi:hypothetical protein